MERKTTWMRFLMLGVFNIILLIGSCKKTREQTQFGEFNFVNQSSHSIDFNYPLLSFKIGSKSKFILNQLQETGNDGVTNKNYGNPIEIAIGPKESILIKFDDNKCLIMTKMSENSLLNNNNYIAEKLGERKYKFTYTFTEADYNRATTCP